MVVIDGVKYKSFDDACKHYEVDSSYLYKKARNTGIAKEELLIEKIKDGVKKYSFSYQGVKYLNLSQFCSIHRLDPQKIQSLMDNRGLKREQAIDLSIKHIGNVPRDRKGIQVSIDGKDYRSKSSAIRELKLSQKNVYALQKNGFSFEQAVKIVRDTKIEDNDQT